MILKSNHDHYTHYQHTNTSLQTTCHILNTLQQENTRSTHETRKNKTKQKQNNNNNNTTNNPHIQHQHTNRSLQDKENTCSTHETRKNKTKQKQNNNNNNTTNNPYIQYQHTNRSLQDNFLHPQYNSNIQIHSLQNNIRVSKVHCGSAFEPGAFVLPYYCTPPVCVPVCVPAVLG